MQVGLNHGVRGCSGVDQMTGHLLPLNMYLVTNIQSIRLWGLSQNPPSTMACPQQWHTNRFLDQSQCKYRLIRLMPHSA